MKKKRSEKSNARPFSIFSLSSLLFSTSFVFTMCRYYFASSIHCPSTRTARIIRMHTEPWLSTDLILAGAYRNITLIVCDLCHMNISSHHWFFVHIFFLSLFLSLLCPLFFTVNRIWKHKRYIFSCLRHTINGRWKIGIESSKNK